MVYHDTRFCIWAGASSGITRQILGKFFRLGYTFVTLASAELDNHEAERGGSLETTALSTNEWNRAFYLIEVPNHHTGRAGVYCVFERTLVNIELDQRRSLMLR